MELSRAIPEQADFSTDVCDNGRVAVAVLPLTPSAAPLACSILSCLRKLPPFQAAEQRDGVLSLKFLSSLPQWVFPDSIRKDGFATSRRRRLACLLCVDYCSSEAAVSKATEGFKEHCKQLGGTLLASRCLIYGPMEPLVDEKRGVSFFNLTCTPDAIAEGEGNIQYNRLEGILSECMATVYSKLNGVTKENDPTKLSGLASLSQETKEGSGGGGTSVSGQQGEDGEQTRLHKVAQARKLLADVHLLCGHCLSAMKLYQSALQELRHFKDHLWMGGALEGVVSSALLLRGMDTAISLALPARTHAETTRYDGTGTRSNSRPNSDIENHDSSIGSRTHSNSSSLGTKKSGDPLRDSISSSGGSDIDVVDVATPTSSVAGDEDLTDYSSQMSDTSIEKNFKLAIDNYSKIGSAGRRAHAETLIMFAGYLAKRNKHRKACQLLEEAQTEANQDSVLSTPELKLSLYLVLSEVYDHMAMQRKTVFMLYYAGKQAIDIAATLEDGNKMDNNIMLKKAYQLLWRCLFQYQSPPDLDKPILPDHAHQRQGWPQLQARFITEFVDLCKKLDHNKLVIRWGWMLLQQFHSLLTPKELNQVTDCITDATVSLKTPGTSSSEDQEISAPSQATNLPVIAVFKPQPLAPQLAVKQSRNLFSSAVTSDRTGPFIYSALFKRKGQESSEVLWVQGDPAEVLLMISNPLPFEIRVEKMTMTLQGGPVTTYPSNITLPACCEPQEFVLLCIPQKPGNLSLTGYKATMFGLRIECIVKSIADLVIQVLPTLPQLRAKIVSLSDGRGSGRGSPIMTKRSSITILDSWELLDGEEVECYFQMQSIGDVSVDNVKMVQNENNEYCDFVWSNGDITKLLPLSIKNNVYHFPLKVYAKIPSYLRVGSCEILPAASYSSTSLNYGPGVVTIYESPRNSPVIDKSASLSQNTARFKHPVVKKSASLHRSMHDPSQFSTSPLMESLDLPQPLASEPKPSPSQAKKFSTMRNHSPVEKQASFSPQSSRRQWKPWRSKATAMAHSTPPSSPQTSIKSISGRLMDSLNLDQPQNVPKQPSDSARNSIVSPDTTSELDFDATTFSDAASLKSEPGDIHPSPSHSTLVNSPSHSASSSSVSKSATISAIRDSAAIKDFTDRLFTDKMFTRVSRKATPVQVGQRTRRTDSAKAALAISAPKGPLHKAVRRPPKVKPVKGVFLLQYTGGEGSKEGYYRQVTVDVSLTIKPTLIFYNFSVATIKGSPDLFHFKIMIENVSQYKLTVTCDIQQAGLETPQHQWMVEGNNKITAQLVLKRFNIAEGTDPHSTQINEVKLYCERLTEMIRFKWTSDKLYKNGNLSLHGLLLPQSALNIIRPLPVLFRPLLKADKYDVGIPIEFQLELTNNSGDVLPPSLVTLHPYQHVSQSMRVTCSKGDQIIFSHSLDHSIPQLLPDQTHQLSLALVFLYKGNYSIEITHHLPQSPPPLPPPPGDEVGGTSPSLNQRATLQQLAKSNSPLLSKLNSLKPLCSQLAPLSRTNSPSFRAKTPVTMAAPIPISTPSMLHRDLVSDSNSYTGSKLVVQIS